MNAVHNPASIFNNVIGPVMAGPSSSHTAGPTRIGKLASQLLGDRLMQADIAFAPSGSFAGTYQGQRSDYGFAGGLLGWDPADERLPEAFNETKAKGIIINFDIKEFAAEHPNTVKIRLEGDQGEICDVTAISVGGGMVELINIDGCPVSIAGDFYETLFFLSGKCQTAMEIIVNILQQNGHKVEYHTCCQGESSSLINIKSREKVADFLISQIKECLPVTKTRQIDPVLPVLSFGEGAAPFKTAKEMLQLIKIKKYPLWQAAAIYESERSGWPVSRVLEEMKQIRLIMKKSIQYGLNGDLDMRGYLGRSAKQIEKSIDDKRHIPTGILDYATPWAIAVMEANSSMGVVVAAPTAGSCGIIPATLFSAAETMNIDEDEQIKALLVAGIIGVIISEQATFAAEVCGCQAECGASSSMAAAALASMVGGTADEAVNAASIALQNLLGLICDPVASLVQIPCFNRNVMGAANAAVSANMALGGFDPVIPFDEVVQAMYQAGKMLPRELRCTGLGGLCSTEKGNEMKRFMRARVGSDLG